MKTKLDALARMLRWTALAILVTGAGLWLSAGARFGWTQTSVVTLRTDQVTGIEYPVREAAFVAGVEVLLLAAATAGTLVVVAWAAARRATSRHA